MKPEISRQLTQLVTRVMNDAFSDLPADKLLNNLNRSARSGQSLVGPLAPVISFPLQHNMERRGQAHRVNTAHNISDMILANYFSGGIIQVPSWQKINDLQRSVSSR